MKKVKLTSSMRMDKKLERISMVNGKCTMMMDLFSSKMNKQASTKQLMNMATEYRRINMVMFTSTMMMDIELSLMMAMLRGMTMRVMKLEEMLMETFINMIRMATK